MDSTPTLHDFVLNLLTDSIARTAFQLDPETALHSAGLGDFGVADVREAIPLVVDSVPVHDLPGLPANLGDLASGLSAFDGSLGAESLLPTTGGVLASGGVLGGGSVLGAGNVGMDSGMSLRLPSLEQRLPFGGQLASTEFNIAAAVTTVSGGYLDLAGSMSNAGISAASAAGASMSGFSSAHDVGHTLDADAHGAAVGASMASLTGGITDSVGGLGGFGDPLGGLGGLGDSAGGLLHDPTGTLGGLLDTTHGLTGDLTNGLDGHLIDQGTLGGLDGVTGLGGVTSSLPVHLPSVDSSAGGAVHGSSTAPAPIGGGDLLGHVTQPLGGITQSLGHVTQPLGDVADLGGNHLLGIADLL
jgi:hypothetical protein